MPHSDAFDRRRFDLLEQIARGALLNDVLEGIICLIEDEDAGVIGSILLVDRERGIVTAGIAPHLPIAFSRLMQGMAIGPQHGSCGAAAFRGERVIVEDIETHPYWENYRSLALPHGLRACWSSPIVSPEGDVMGTFAMYYREVHTPTPDEIEVVDAATHLASIAILRDRSLSALRRSEARATHMARLYAVASGVGDALVRIRDVQQLYELACRIPVEQSFARLAWIGLIEADGRLRPMARVGADDGYVDRVAANIGEIRQNRGPTARAIATGVPATSNHIESDPDFKFRDDAVARGLRSCAVFPLLLRGEAVGILSLYADRAGVFGPDEVRVLRTLAEDVSFAVESLAGEQERRRLVHDLGERVKELTLLHQTARLLQSGRPFDRTLAADLVARVPAAWQHPAICEARLAWRDIEASTPGWRETPWRQRAAFDGGAQGVIEVCYLQEPPADPLAPGGSTADPFLREEHELLRSLADMLAVHLAREASDAARRESDASLRAIIELTPNVAIQWFDAAGRLRFANQASLALFGWDPVDAVGRTLDELNFSRAEARKFAEAIAGVAATGRPFGPAEFEFRRADGSDGVLLSTVFAIPFEEGEPRYVCMDIDLTDYRRMEEYAHASETLRSVIYRSVADVIFYLAVEPGGGFRFQSVNPAFLRATGLTDDQVIGRAVGEVIPEPSLTYVLDRYRTAIAERRPVSWEEVSDYPSGRRFGEVTVVPIFDDDGRCTHLLGTVHDFTERARAEEERRALESRLHQAQRLQSLGTFAGGIAHDFNNILTAIGGHADFAGMDLPPDHPARESLLEIRTATHRASKLVRQILTFSRHEEPQRALLSLETVVHEALNLLRASVKTQVAEIRARVDVGTPLVMADATQIHQVLMNLGVNAARAIDDRGLIEVVVERIDVSDRNAPAPDLAPGAYARITFRDNGCGMDDATRMRVFEPFFSTRPSAEGTGLGLSVVHGIVQGHQGAVTVESAPGRGTTFRLYFPAADGVSPPPEPPSVPSGHGRGEHVLYVDDDRALVHLAMRTLTRLGFRVTGMVSPLQALEALRADPRGFDALVTDLAMPALSGIELARAARSARGDLPIVMLSGRVRPADAAAAREMGVDVLLKPYSATELAGALHRVLRAQTAQT